MNTKSYFFARVARVIRLPDNFMLASGMNTNDEACGANQEGATHWTRGGAGVASVLEVCLKDSADAYAWTQNASGGTVGLAAHILDTTTHGTTGNIVGTSDVQTLTNKTLTAPVIADLTNMQHPHTGASSGGALSAAAIASGVIATARLGSGTADSLVFLRGDQTWSSLPVAPGTWPAAFVTAFGTNGTSNGQFTSIRAIVVKLSDGSVYIASDNRIQKFSANGTWIATIATAGTGDGQVDAPSGLAISALDNLFVADTGNNRLQKFDSADTFSAKAGTVGSGEGEYDAPSGMSMTLGETVLVADTNNNRIVEVGGDLSFVREIPEPLLPGDGPSGGFSAPTGVGYGQAKNWVADTGNDRIVFFQAGFIGPSYFVSGSAGADPAQFDSPHSVAVDRFGNVYVTDTGNHRVQVLDRNGVFQGTIGSFGTGDGQFDGPTAIAVTDDYIYVADSGNSRVQIFTSMATRRRDTIYVPFWTYTPTLSTQYNWANMPAAETEFISSPFWRVPVDLTGMSEARLHVYVSVVGVAGSEFRAQYSTNNSTYAPLAASGNVTVPITATGAVAGDWAAIAAGAKGPVWVRPVGAGGNSVADPQILTLGIQFR